MINPVDPTNVIHSEMPSHVIDMGEMDRESIAFMLSQSRDGFYSNKELAPIREYSTNAFDSHVQSGIPTTPIQITLPTQMEPELRIRDFGAGLTEKELAEVYFKYWKSTKRATNDLNGFFGVGSKSAMAYSDIYTIISICGGVKMIYTAHKNGTAERIYIGANTENERTGIEVIIPVQQKDIQKFVSEALNFFQYWAIKPTFKNVSEDLLKGAFATMETKPFIEGNDWAVRPAGFGSGRTVAIMSNVAYTIDWEQVKGSISPEASRKIGGIFTFLEENVTTLYFRNGSLSFTTNREALQYNEITVTEITNRLIDIYNRLLTLLSEKISDAPNLWEAKIRYNQIFRKDLEGFDKSIAYGGNLSTIESLLKNRIQWNNIVISNGMFENLEYWDVQQGQLSGRCDSSNECIITTYVKDEQKTGIVKVKSSRRRRWSYESKNIICSPKSAVIIQDTQKNSLAKGFARWILYKSGKEISQVYVLDLSKPEVKEQFYKHYNFETVPVHVVSQNELLIKAYLKTIRAPRGTYSSGSVEREPRTVSCPVISIENRRDESGHVMMPCWRIEDMNPRHIEGGGYYVIYSTNSFNNGRGEMRHEDARYFWQAIYDLSKAAGVDLPKVYGIKSVTAQSDWFTDAVEDGEWTNISEFIKENIDSLPKDIIKKMSAYYNADDNRVGISAALMLNPLLVDENGVAGKYFKEITAIASNWHIKHVPNVLGATGFEHDEAELERFVKLNGAMKTKYPLLFKSAEKAGIINCEPKPSYNRLSQDTAKDLADYINLVDCYS